MYTSKDYYIRSQDRAVIVAFGLLRSSHLNLSLTVQLSLVASLCLHRAHTTTLNQNAIGAACSTRVILWLAICV